MNAKEMLAEVRRGGEIHIITYWRHIRIDKKCLDKFEKLDAFLFGDSGDNFLLASGKKRVFVYRRDVQLVMAKQ